MQNLSFERVELYHSHTLICNRITELEDFKLSHPHMSYVADEQLAIYYRMRDKVVAVINDGISATSAVYF